MAAKQSQFNAYRFVTAADPPMPLPPALRDNVMLETRNFDGVALRCNYNCGGGIVGYTLEVWFYESQTGEYFQDRNQTITVQSEGPQQFEVKTRGQWVLFRINELTGLAPMLEIKTGVYTDSKV